MYHETDLVRGDRVHTARRTEGRTVFSAGDPVRGIHTYIMYTLFFPADHLGCLLVEGVQCRQFTFLAPGPIDSAAHLF